MEGWIVAEQRSTRVSAILINCSALQADNKKTDRILYALSGEEARNIAHIGG